MLQAISHASAKAAMFMAAGLIYHALGHDRIAGLAGVARALPISVLTFVLAGLALMGLPPSGAYVAKKLLLDAAAGTGQWWWDVVMQVGGLLTASYVVLVLAHGLRRADAPIKLHAPISRLAEVAALALAMCSLLLGFAAVGAGVPDARSSAFTPEEVLSAALLIVGGAALAVGLARHLPAVSVGNGVATIGRPIRRATVAVGSAFVRVDDVLRQWPVAALALIVLAIAFGVALGGR
jgi:NADH:ubiquinone oxidoreductase subunit 5 (subunit L)/multisubunit Na+/H+ antiporter MnhA subunit